MKTIHDYIAPIIIQWYCNCSCYIHCAVNEREKAEHYYFRLQMDKIAIEMIMKGEY